MEKRVSIRLSNEMYKDLVSVSNFVEIDKTKLIRMALDAYLERCRQFLGEEEIEPA